MSTGDVSWANVAREGVPPELKPIQSQLQRAREIAPRDPAIAYWLLFAAAQDGLRIHPPSSDARKLLATLVGALEQAKSSDTIKDSPLVNDNQLAQRHVRTFALGVFTKADNEDRAGKATRNTARTFLAAATFLDLLRLFPENETQDAEDKIKYAKWKAADIGKALREGRTPAPGPPGWDPEQEKETQDAVAEAQDAIAQAHADENAVQAEVPLDPGEEAELAREMEKLLGGTDVSVPDAPSELPNAPSELPDAPPEFPDAPPALPGVSDSPPVPPVVPTSPPPASIERPGSGSSAKSTEGETAELKKRPPLPVPPPGTSPEPTERAYSSRPLPIPPGPSAPGQALGDVSTPSAPSAPFVPSIPSVPSAPLIFPDSPSVPSAPPAPPPSSKPSAPPSLARGAGAAAAAPPASSTALPMSLSPQKTAQVQKLAKYAASALDFDDLDTARRELSHALAILNGER